MCLDRAIMKRAKTFIPRNLEIAVVHFEISMMHLMVKRAECQLATILYQQVLVSCMRCRRRQRLVLHVEQDVNRAGGYDAMNQDRAEKDQMFDGMHG